MDGNRETGPELPDTPPPGTSTTPASMPVVDRYQVAPDGRLWLHWTDGHESALDPLQLRAACPCASCEVAGPVMADDPVGDDPRVPRLPRHLIRRIRNVGAYAMYLQWGDGHDAGIYPYRRLRELCGCLHCRMERGTS